MGQREDVAKKSSQHKNKMRAQEENIDKIKQEQMEKIAAMKERRYRAKLSAEVSCMMVLWIE